MAQRIEHFNVLAPVGNPSPGINVPITFTEGIVTGFSIHIPAGHAGRTGLQLWYADNQVIPFKKNTRLHGNKATYHFDTEDYPTGPGWFANVTNTDIHSHTFRCSVYLDEMGLVLEDLLPSLVLLPPAGGTLVV